MRQPPPPHHRLQSGRISVLSFKATGLASQTNTLQTSLSCYLTHLVKVEHKLYNGAMDTWTKRTLLLALGVRSATMGKEGSLMGCLLVAHYSVRRSFRVPTPPQHIETP